MAAEQGGASTTATSLRVSRVLRAPRAKVYRAFLDKASPAMARFAPNQAPGKPMAVTLHDLEPRVGGAWRLTMTAAEGDFKGSYTAHGRYLELVENERIVQSHTWEDPDEPQPTTKVTITFRDVPGGTEVTLVHEGLPTPQSVASHAGGWAEALANLAAAFAAA